MTVAVDGLQEVLLHQASLLSIAEIVAVMLAVAYLLLAIRQNIWCWLCAMISTAIYIVLFMQAKLYMESLLNAFYFGMAVYGWRVWRCDSGDSGSLAVSTRSRKTHLVALVVIAVLSLTTGYLLDAMTDAAYPMIDSLTTYSAIWATWLVAKKVLENWWYWLAIDLVSIPIYWSRDLEFTSLLFVVYVLMIPFGLVAWQRSYRRDRALETPA